jgi:hypothetical protein
MTASTGSATTLTLESLNAALAKLPPRNTEWMLISPEGHVYKGDVQTMFRVLAPHHSVVQFPIPPDFQTEDNLRKTSE